MRTESPSSTSIRRGERIQEDVSSMILQLRRRLREGRLMTFKDWIRDVRDLLRHLK